VTRPFVGALLGLATYALAARPAAAVDAFEIQVYEGDINRVGQAGLELHSNYTASGRTQPAFPGEVVPDGLLRLTLEPSFGVLPWWEVGAYLESATATGDLAAHWGGFKLRSKFVVPAARTTPFVFGANFEIGRGAAALGMADWEVEVRPIATWASGRWSASVNPILGWTLTGAERSAAPDFEPALKTRVAATPHIALGVEYYASLGRVSSPSPWHEQEHYLYAAGDLLNGPIELNLGIGRGLTDASAAWTIKAIVGRTF